MYMFKKKIHVIANACMYAPTEKFSPQYKKISSKIIIKTRQLPSFEKKHDNCHRYLLFLKYRQHYNLFYFLLPQVCVKTNVYTFLQFHIRVSSEIVWFYSKSVPLFTSRYSMFSHIPIYVAPWDQMRLA